MQRWFPLLILLVGGTLTPVPIAALGPQAAAAEVPENLVKDEQTARKKGADVLYKLARTMAQKRAYATARREVRRALVLQPGNERLQREMEKLDGKEDDAKPGVAEELAEKRLAAHKECVELLAGAASGYDAVDLTEPFDALFDVVYAQFPDVDVRKRFRMYYYEPYVRWVRETDLKRYRMGSELVNGKWVGAAEMQKLNAEHSTWENPWVLEDALHQVTTNMQYRTARTVLSHVGAYREKMIAYLDGEWLLKFPAAKLPVIVTDTHADYKGWMKKLGADGENPTSAAVYIPQRGALGPCLLTFEMFFQDPSGGHTARVGLENILGTLRHELTHQIGFECSKYNVDPSRDVRHQFWAVEGMADFMGAFAIDENGWRLTHPNQEHLGPDVTVIGGFAWCKMKKTVLKPLAEFVAYDRGMFMDEARVTDNYNYAATFTYFLLEGANRKYRKAAIEVISRVHMHRDTPELFGKFLGEFPMETMQAEFLEFVGNLKIDM